MPLMWIPFLLSVLSFQLTISLGPCEQKSKEGEIEPICNIGNWDKTYYNIEKETGNGIGTKDVRWVSFRLYSTKKAPFTGKQAEWKKTDLYEELVNDWVKMTAYIKNGTTDHLKHLDQEDYSYAVADKPTMFDPTLPTIVVAHGNGGGFKLDQYMWAYFSKSALAGITPHFNILGIRWGFGIIGKTTFAGIKAARVVEYLHNEYGLDVSTIHGIGFSYGGHVVSAMAAELYFSGLGKVDRLSLLDPGSMMKKFKVSNKEYWGVGGKEQIGSLNRYFTNFMDVYHSSTTGVWDRRVGHLDVWLNGGKQQHPNGIYNSKEHSNWSAHSLAVQFFAHSITNSIWTGSEDCQFHGWRCDNWKSPAPYAYKDRAKAAKVCNYGDSKKDNVIVGQMTDCYSRADKCDGNYLVYFNLYNSGGDFQFLMQRHDPDCSTHAQMGPDYKCTTI